MRKALALVVFLAFGLSVSAAQNTQVLSGTTTDGRQVLLKPDGTWSFVQQTPAAAGGLGTSANLPRFVKNAGAIEKIDAQFGRFSVWIDPGRWKVEKNEGGRVSLNSVDGKGYAMIIPEAISVPTSTLKELVLANAQQADPDARIVSEEKRIVNGREVLCLQMDATIKKMPIRYYGYYYGGSSGNIQLLTFTLRSSFEEKKADFTEFLNGLVISDNAVPDQSAETASDTKAQSDTITVNDGKISLVYDTHKWRAPKKKENTLTLSHVKGGGYVMIIPESIAIPMDAFPDVALENAKDADPDAKIIFREKRTVNGREVWCLKLAATISKIPFTYYGYYYGGPDNSVQVVAYTTSANFNEYEADFTEFLNGIRFAKTSEASASGK